MKIKMHNKFISLDYLNICFLLLTFGIRCNAKVEFSCRTGYKEIEGKCMAMVKYDKGDDRSWQSARTICVGLGGDLASLNTPKLMMAADVIRKAAKMTTLNMYWIGLTDEEEEGIFRWTDKQKLKPTEAPWLPGEPETSNPEEDYVAASGVGWTDRTNKWIRTINKEVVEPSGFLCETKLFRVVSQSDKKSARPIIIEKRNDPVNSKATEKSTASEFQSAVVNKETGETADDFYQLKPDLDFNFPFGEYGAGAYRARSSKQHHNHQHQSPRYHHQHRSPSPGYRAQPSVRRGYKPGHVHRGDRGGYGSFKPQNNNYKPSNQGYSNQRKNYHHPKPKSWYGNNRGGNRLRQSGYPREQLKQHYPEHNNDVYKKKQHDSHHVNPYSHKTDYFISVGRQNHGHFDPNKEGFCRKNKPGAHAHPYNCNKYFVCYSNYLATEFNCGYGRKWSGNTCIEDETCKPHVHVSRLKKYYDPSDLVAEKADDQAVVPPSPTASTTTTA